MGRPDVAFFDIDGTLIHTSQELYAAAQAPDATQAQKERVFLPTLPVREAIERFIAAGNLAFLCSGRLPDGLAMLMDAIPFSGFVAAAGTHAQIGDRVLFTSDGVFDKLIPALDAFERCGVTALFEGSYDAVVYKPAGEHPSLGADRMIVRDAEEIRRRGSELGLAKAFWPHAETWKMDPVRSQLERRYRLCDLGADGIELTLPELTKGRAMAKVLEAVGDHGCVYAFGDSENDLTMLEAADVAVVMDNAADNVKAYGDLIAPSVTQDGVAQVLDAITNGEDLSRWRR